jgi:serine/threonine-protein kinase ULK/ATG1
MRTANTQIQRTLTPRPVSTNDLSAAYSQQPKLLIERISNIRKIGDYAIQTDRLIGKGHYGKVYQCYDIKDRNGPALVCKIIEREALSAKGEKMIKNEILNLQMIDQSEGVITLVKTFKTSSHYYLITELCNGGDVSQLLAARGGRLSESVARLILSKIAVGLDDLHSAGILHRDIKLPNILLNFEAPVALENGDVLTQEDLIQMSFSQKMEFLAQVDLHSVKFSVKIADLGFSKYSAELDNAQANMTMCGTPLYMSPQIVREGEYSAKTDIWSMGAIFFEMLTGVTPFQSKSMKQLDRDMQRGAYTM